MLLHNAHENSIHKNIKFDCHDCSRQYKDKGALITYDLLNPCLSYSLVYNISCKYITPVGKKRSNFGGEMIENVSK